MGEFHRNRGLICRQLCGGEPNPCRKIWQPVGQDPTDHHYMGDRRCRRMGDYPKHERKCSIAGISREVVENKGSKKLNLGHPAMLMKNMTLISP
jgi:hypothetical protein